MRTCCPNSFIIGLLKCVCRADLLLRQETHAAGEWVFILDQTYVGQQGVTTENTFSRANYRQRPPKGHRQNKKHAKRSGHGFVMGLLLSPSGLRIPCCRRYYTQGYGQAKKYPYRTHIALAAALIRQVVVPAGAAVVVLGDTAFATADIRDACVTRGWTWVMPLHPERVLAGPKVRSLVSELTAESFQTVRLVPGQGHYTAQRRAARCRLGPKAKARTYYVQAERRQVHKVGDVLLVFSTKQQPTGREPVIVPKVLLTKALQRTAAQVVRGYDWRWQIALFFKERQGTLGLHHYRFQQFLKVENGVQACLTAFGYLEWYRAGQRRRRQLPEERQRWWRWQRRHGLTQAVSQAAEEHDLTRLYQRTETPTGRRKLRKRLREALPQEYRPAG